MPSSEININFLFITIGGDAILYLNFSLLIKLPSSGEYQCTILSLETPVTYFGAIMDHSNSLFFERIIFHKYNLSVFNIKST